jgi:hypothetical protein
MSTIPEVVIFPVKIGITGYNPMKDSVFASLYVSGSSVSYWVNRAGVLSFDGGDVALLGFAVATKGMQQLAGNSRISFEVSKNGSSSYFESASLYGSSSGFDTVEIREYQQVVSNPKGVAFSPGPESIAFIGSDFVAYSPENAYGYKQSPNVKGFKLGSLNAKGLRMPNGDLVQGFTDSDVAAVYLVGPGKVPYVLVATSENIDDLNKNTGSWPNKIGIPIVFYFDFKLGDSVKARATLSSLETGEEEAPVYSDATLELTAPNIAQKTTEPFLVTKGFVSAIESTKSEEGASVDSVTYNVFVEPTLPEKQLGKSVYYRYDDGELKLGSGFDFPNVTKVNSGSSILYSHEMEPSPKESADISFHVFTLDINGKLRPPYVPRFGSTGLPYITIRKPVDCPEPKNLRAVTPVAGTGWATYAGTNPFIAWDTDGMSAFDVHITATSPTYEGGAKAVTITENLLAVTGYCSLKPLQEALRDAAVRTWTVTVKTIANTGEESDPVSLTIPIHSLGPAPAPIPDPDLATVVRAKDANELAGLLSGMVSDVSKEEAVKVLQALATVMRFQAKNGLDVTIPGIGKVFTRWNKEKTRRRCYMAPSKRLQHEAKITTD